MGSKPRHGSGFYAPIRLRGGRGPSCFVKRARARTAVQELDQTTAHMWHRRSRPWRATPGQPVVEGEPTYRSSWERSVAESLTRLGIRFTYEPESFAYPGVGRRIHRYTPDFRLDDFHATFVEVKGRAGPDAADEIKMQRVLRRYPDLTLLLWDADVVEFIEDITEPMFVVQLITTTRLVAA